MNPLPDVSLNDMIALRNRIQPHYKDNSSAQLFDYHFWSRVETMARKNRDDALAAMNVNKDTLDTAQTVRETHDLRLTVSVTRPHSFNIDAYIEAVSKKLRIPKHKLIELKDDGKVDGSPRRTFKVEAV